MANPGLEPLGPVTAGHLAFVDESGSDAARDPNTYIVAASLCTTEAVEAVRTCLRRLRLPAQRKLHWRDESQRRRMAITKAVARCSLQHLVAVRTGTAGEPTERQRRLCLEHLWYELEARAVEVVVLESRGKADDKRDRDHLDALRARRTIVSPLRIGHEPGASEPLLWVPDAVCGVVSSLRTDTDAYYRLVADTIQITTLRG